MSVHSWEVVREEAAHGVVIVVGVAEVVNITQDRHMPNKARARCLLYGYGADRVGKVGRS